MDNRPSKMRVIAAFAAVLMVLLLLTGLVNFMIAPSGVEPLTEWKYASSDKLNYLRSLEEEDLDPVGENGSLLASNTYLLLSGTLPKSEYDTLFIQTEHNRIRVTVEGKIIYDTLSHTGGIFGRKNNAIPLKDSYNGKPIEVIVYGPLSVKFEAYLGYSGSTILLLGQPFDINLIFAVVFFVFAAIALLVFFGRRTYKSALYVAALCLMGFAVLFKTDILSGTASGLVLAGKLSCAALSAASALLIALPFSDSIDDGNVKEGYFVFNAGYVLAVTLWPYGVFLENVISLAFVIQIINVLVMAYEVHERWDDIVPNYCVGVAGVIYSLSVLTYLTVPTYNKSSFTCYLFMLCAAVMTAIVEYLAAMGMFAVAAVQKPERPKKVKAPKPKKEPKVKPQKEPKKAPKVTAEPAPAEDIDSALPTELRAQLEEIYGEEKAAFVAVAGKIDVGTLLDRLVNGSNDEIAHHMFIVAKYVYTLCGKFGMDAARITDYSDAALLHDMGKLCIPDSILYKTEKLTNDEFTMIKRHNMFGYDILKKDGEPFNMLAARVAQEHHENYDGSGYLGYKDEQICLAAKITAVADVFSALTAPRQYKKIWSFDEAFEYILTRSGSFFDPAVVKLFEDSKKEISDIYDKYQVPFLTKAKLQ